MKIDGANLLDGIMGNTMQGEIQYGTVSTGTEEKLHVQETEKLSKGQQETNVIYHKPQREKKSGTVEDVMQQASDIDAAQMKEKMVVASHTTTTTDCRKMEKDGFSLQQTDIETVVTVTDKIKIQLAKTGVDVSYFGDSLSAGQLKEITGNAVLAQKLAGAMQQADLPLTEENIRECLEVIKQAEELHPLNEGALKYMLDNQLEPTVANLYKAQYSGSAMYADSTFAQMNVSDRMVFSDMQEQISKIIIQSGQDENEQTTADSQWLIQNQVPLTAENLNYLKQLKSIKYPIDEEELLDSMAAVMTAGMRPQDAVLLDEYSLEGQAQHAVDVMQQVTEEDLACLVNEGQKINIENLEKIHNQNQAGVLSTAETEEAAQLIQSADDSISEEAADSIHEETADNIDDINKNTSDSVNEDTQIEPEPRETVQNDHRSDHTQILFITARRQMEEVRLLMTIDASYNMLKQGISVSTSPMENLIEQLKEMEKHYYRDLLTQGGIEASEANINQFAETVEKIEQLKGMPAYALGVQDINISTLNDLHQTGSEMQQNFQQANERYETMQTQVRKDLGDSIQKAFRNVDDILQDLDMEADAANERAVRILGYNQVPITRAAVIQMKAADQQVQMAFDNLTPAAVREFISRGINPLDMDIIQLNRQAEQIKSELNIDSPEEKYSEYLYKLEQNQSITPEERDTYIGIYRLINQVAQSDGAAIGALINQGAELTMRNLLSAVRSQKHSKMNISVDNSFGELRSGGYRDSIIDQIEAAYQNQCVRQAADEISPERMRSMSNENETNWQEMTPEQFLQQLTEAPEDTEAEEAYYQQQLDDLAKCTQASQEVYQVLEQYDLPNTMLNVMAISELMQNRSGMYRRFFQMNNKNTKRRPDSELSAEEYITKNEDGSVDVDFDAVKAEMLERFSEDLKRPEELAKAMAELAECAEKCMSTMIIEPDVTSLDIRELKLMNAQISVSAKMASSECFSMPIVIDGEVTNVTLKIVRGREQKGLVNITLETERFGKIAAELRAKQKGISGYAAVDSRRTLDLLQSKKDDIIQALKQEQDETVDLNFVMSDRLDLNQFAANSGRSEEPESEELREVQTKTLYGMAEGFIRVLKQIERKL